jgi:hypothetical protein
MRRNDNPQRSMLARLISAGIVLGIGRPIRHNEKETRDSLHFLTVATGISGGMTSWQMMKK